MTSLTDQHVKGWDSLVRHVGNNITLVFIG
jgi:hypothetical protein